MNSFQEEEYNTKFDLSPWIKIWEFLKSSPTPAILLTLCNILYSFIHTLVPRANKYAVDVFITQRDLATFPIFAILCLGAALLSAFLTYKTIEYSSKIDVTMSYHMREAGFRKLQELSFSYYDTTPVGWIMARMTSDIYKVCDCLAWSVLDLVWFVFIVFFTVINMLLLDVKLAIMTFSVMPFVIAVSIFFQRRILKNQRVARRLNSKITGAFNEGISGARTTKTLVSEERNFAEFKELSKGMRKAGAKTAMLSAMYVPCVSAFGSLATALVIYLGTGEMLRGAISLGTLTAFINYSMQIFEPINQAARILSEVQSAQASAERVTALLSTEAEVKDSQRVAETYGSFMDAKRENWEKIEGEIEFKNVTFSYKTGEKVLENFNLKVKKGERIALVGETGAGKSTIVNLLCRFYEPVTGEILIDGTDYRERSQLWLHSSLGYVLQSPHLFSGSVMENIRYGSLGATDEQVIEAAKKVNAYDFIMKFDKGFDFQVGEGGNRLSSGEKQLISFARAILKEPAIFVLDEATSAIDTESEKLIQEAIGSVLNGRTSFIIAHRLSSVRDSDRILVIHNGEIAEQGSHRQLLRKKGIYYKLYTDQFITSLSENELAAHDKELYYGKK